MNNLYNNTYEQIKKISLIDTHEHLIDESERLKCVKPFIQCDDWTTILGLYAKFDFVSSGMSPKEVDIISSQKASPLDKWKIIEPFWDLIEHTGYGKVFRYTIQDLFHISDLNAKTIPELQERYLEYRKEGFYKETLQRANINRCIVNPPGRPFKNTEAPEILSQDIDATGIINMDFERYNENVLPTIKNLDDWLEVIEWWFNQYSVKAAGVKIGNAYFRRLNFQKVGQEAADPIFSMKIRGNKLSETEEKNVQDFLFWYVVDLATKKELPVKLHTGHQAMNNFMSLENIMYNPADCATMCRLSPETIFIFYHLSYPNYEPMLSLTKHYSNAIIDMCWSWTLNPMASIDFLKKYILMSPLNKLLVFGGDDVYIENLIGHAELARKGISTALSELVQGEWITEQEMIEIANRIMWKNAEIIYPS